MTVTATQLIPRPGSAVRSYGRLAIGAFGIAAASLLLPSANTPDAWHWILWGRQLAHLDLDVTGTWVGWKPLPALFTLPFGLFPAAAPSLWLLVARASGIMAVVLSWRLAGTLARLHPVVQAKQGSQPAFVAGLVAALFSFEIIFSASMNGFSEGLIALLALAAVERALSGHRKAAVALGLIASLGRPEALPVVIGFGLLAVREGRDRWLAALLAAGPFLVLAAWLVPDWAASGSFARVLRQASDYSLQANAPNWAKGGPEAIPALFGQVLPTAGWLAALAGILVSGLAARKGEWRPIATATIGFGWLAISLIEVAAGGPAIPRYIAVPAVVLSVMAGYGAGVAAITVRARLSGIGRIGPGRARLVVTALTVVAFSATAALSTVPKAASAITRHGAVAGSMEDLDQAIKAAGGPSRVRKCLPLARRASTEAILAWKLGVSLRDFSFRGSLFDPKIRFPFRFGTTVRSTDRARYQDVMDRPDRIARGAKLIGSHGRWQIWQKCDVQRAQGRGA